MCNPMGVRNPACKVDSS